MITAIFLHGFASVGAFQDKSPFNDIKFIAPTYTPHDTASTLKQISAIIDRNLEHTPVLIGHSLGGLWADYFGRKYHLPAILLNPAIDIKNTLGPWAGTYRNFLTNEPFTLTQLQINELIQLTDDRKQMSLTNKRTILLTADDNIVPPYPAQQEFSCCKVVTFENGGHFWTRWPEVHIELTAITNDAIINTL